MGISSLIGFTINPLKRATSVSSSIPRLHQVEEESRGGGGRRGGALRDRSIRYNSESARVTSVSSLWNWQYREKGREGEEGAGVRYNALQGGPDQFCLSPSRKIEKRGEERGRGKKKRGGGTVGTQVAPSMRANGGSVNRDRSRRGKMKKGGEKAT